MGGLSGVKSKALSTFLGVGRPVGGGGGLVGGGLVGLGVAVVLDVSDVAGVAVDGVGHGLGAAVGEEDGVAAVGVVAGGVLRL